MSGEFAQGRIHSALSIMIQEADEDVKSILTALEKELGAVLR